MGKAKDSISWFGSNAKEGAKAGADTVKIAGQAAGIMIGVAMVGIAARLVNNVFGGNN
jgi:hypothetical protein